MANTQRQLDVLAPRLSCIWLADAAVAEQISRITRSHRHSSVRLLCKSSGKAPAPLLQLCHRLGSRLQVRVLLDDTPAPPHSFALGDASHLFFIPQDAEPQGLYRPDATPRVRQYRQAFEHLWHYGSADDPELRALFI